MTNPTTPDFRALCATIVELWDADCDIHVEINELRELLATPPPEPPTIMEILALIDEIDEARLGQIHLVRAALERWGK